MRPLKQFSYSIGNDFMTGTFITWNKRRVRRYLRRLLGWKTYLQVRKDIVITEGKL